MLQALDERAPQDLGRGGLVLRVVAAALTGVALAGSPASAQLPPAGPASASEHARWRAEREAELRAEDGWLSVAGLFFLEPGANSFGSASTNAVVLPADASPARAGVFTLAGERVFFDVSDAAEATLAGRPVRRGELRPASAEPARPADELRLGRLTLLAHRSGSRLAIRLRDPDGPVRRTFTGTRWFEVDPTWRVTGTFEAFASPRSVRILNVLGDRIELRSPGMVHFTREGRSHSLLALTEGDRLWLVFTDTTAGRDTYEAARFLYAPMPAGGRVELDFNRAHNPPCAYNPFTTCPLPPRENRLPIPVRAGEKAYPDRWRPDVEHRPR